MAGKGTKIVDAFVAIHADLDAYWKDVQAAKGGAQGLGASIRAAIATGIGKTPLGPLLSALGNTAPIRALNAVLSTTKGILTGIVSTLATVGKGLVIGGGVALGVGLGGAVAGAAAVIARSVDQAQEYAKAVGLLKAASAATSEEASRLAGTMQYLGIPISAATTAVTGLSQSLQGNEERLNRMGVATRDANGNWLSQVRIIDNLRSAISKMGGGVESAKALLESLGQGSLASLAQYFALTDAQVGKLNADLEAQGLILTDSTVKAAEAVERSWNRVQNALTGLGVKIFDAVGNIRANLLDRISEWITRNADQIAQWVQSVLGYVTGLVSGFLNLGSVVGGFSRSFTEATDAAGGTSATMVDLNLQLDDAKAALKKAEDAEKSKTTATKADTSAIDAQIATLARLEASQKRTYDAQIKRLNDQLDAQIRLMDAEDKRAARADEDSRLQNDIQRASIALDAVKEEIRRWNAEGKVTTTEQKYRLIEAERGLVDAQNAVADAAKQRARDDRRDQIQGVKDYIAQIDAIVSDSGLSDASKALRLKRRRESLVASGADKAAPGSDAALELAAVVAAEKRVAEATANAKKQTVLEAKRQEILEVQTLTKNAAVQEAKDNVTRIEGLIAEEQRRIDAREKAERESQKRLVGMFHETYEVEVPRSFATAAAEGEKMAARISEALVGKDGKGGLLGLVVSLKDAITDLFSNVQVPDWLPIAGAIVGFRMGGPAGAAIGLLAGSLALRATESPEDLAKSDDPYGQIYLPAYKKWRDRMRNQNGGTLPPKPGTFQILDWLQATFPSLSGNRAEAYKWAERLGRDPAAYARGGWAGLNGPEVALLGDGGGPEFVLPHDLSKRLIGAPGTSAGAALGQPAIIHVDLDGHTVARLIDRRLALLPRK